MTTIRAIYFFIFAAGLYAQYIPALTTPVSIPVAYKRGNTDRFQLASNGSVAASDCAQFDADGNLESAGAPCGTGAGALYSNISGLLTNASSVVINQAHIASGDVDLYTVPANKRLLVTCLRFYNDSGSGVNAYGQIKISGSYYQVTPVVALTANAHGVGCAYFILEAGEILSANVATGSVVNVFVGGAILFDDTASIRSVYLTSLAAGNNTVFTATGNGAVVLGSGPGTTTNFQVITNGSVGYSNRSSASRTINSYCVASGGSPSGENKTVSTQTVTNTSAQTFGTCSNLAAGDFLVISTDANTATQFAWATVVTF